MGAEGSDEEDDDEESDEDDDDDDDEDEDDGLELSVEEMEKQKKIEKIALKAIRMLLSEKCKDGFPVDELIQKLEGVNVRNWTPEKAGYKSVEKFIKSQP